MLHFVATSFVATFVEAFVEAQLLNLTTSKLKNLLRIRLFHQKSAPIFP